MHFQGPSREELLSKLRGRLEGDTLPITLGRYSPQAVLDVEDGVFMLWSLELDHEAARREGEARMARGEPWMPEMEYRFIGKGKVLLKAASQEELIQAIEKMSWTYGP